jgi:hypothetical protein
MQTECSADLFGVTSVEGCKVVAAFDAGQMTSDAGAILLGATDKQIRLIERFAGCFTDYRVADLVEHTVPSLVGELIDRVPHGNARLGLSRPPAIIAGAHGLFASPCRGTAFCKSWLGLMGGENRRKTPRGRSNSCMGLTARALSVVRFRLSAIRAN